MGVCEVSPSGLSPPTTQLLNDKFGNTRTNASDSSSFRKRKSKATTTCDLFVQYVPLAIHLLGTFATLVKVVKVKERLLPHLDSVGNRWPSFMCYPSLGPRSATQLKMSSSNRNRPLSPRAESDNA